MIEKDICWEICDILECGKNGINLLGLIYKFCNCDFRFLKLIIQNKYICVYNYEQFLKSNRNCSFQFFSLNFDLFFFQLFVKLNKRKVLIVKFFIRFLEVVIISYIIEMNVNIV